MTPVEQGVQELARIASEIKAQVDAKPEIMRFDNFQESYFGSHLGQHTNFGVKFIISITAEGGAHLIEFLADIELQGQHAILQLSVKGKTLIDIDIQDLSVYLNELKHAEQIMLEVLENPARAMESLDQAHATYQQASQLVRAIGEELLQEAESIVREIKAEISTSQSNYVIIEDTESSIDLLIRKGKREILAFQVLARLGKPWKKETGNWTIFVELDKKVRIQDSGTLADDLTGFADTLQHAKSLVMETLGEELAGWKIIEAAKATLVRLVTHLRDLAETHRDTVREVRLTLPEEEDRRFKAELTLELVKGDAIKFSGELDEINYTGRFVIFINEDVLASETLRRDKLTTIPRELNIMRLTLERFITG